MKKLFFLLTIVGILFFIGCSEEDEPEIQTINTDISVTSSEELIYWTDQNELNTKIENSLQYNYGNALESELNKTLSFNSDLTVVTASISFKEEFQHKYYDSNLANNTVTIALQEGLSTDDDFDLTTPLTQSQYQALIDYYQNSQFDIDNSEVMDIPITFHLIKKTDGSGSSISNDRINEIISRFNSLYSSAMLNFFVCEIDNINDSSLFDIDNSDIAVRNEIVNTHNKNNTLNIYFVNEINNNPGAKGYSIHFENNPTDDFIVVRNDRTSDEYATAEHEVGHFFRLIHTHGPSNTELTYELADGSNCATTGDLVCDTAADPKLTNGFLVDNSCEYVGNKLDRAGNPFVLEEDDVRNIMSYGIARPSGDDCRNVFTNGQMEKVADIARNYRSYLDPESCQPSGNSEITLSGNINFPNTQINTTSQQMSFDIVNTGDADFNVTNIISSNENVFEIVGGGSSGVLTPTSPPMTIYVTFNPTQVQNYSETITVENNADSGDYTLQVSGSGVDNNSGNSTIQITPSSFTFNDTQINTSSAQQEFTITNSGDANFNVTNITSSNNSIFSITGGSSGVITPSGSMTFNVTFNPTQVQSYNGTITVDNDADGGNGAVSVSGSGINNNAGDPNLSVQTIDIDDDSTSGSSNGNNDGNVDAGEEIELLIELQNNGNATATNVSATISTTDSDITISDDSENFDDIVSGGNSWTNADFDFDVSADCPTKMVTFTIDIVSDQGSWSDTFDIQIQGGSSGLPEEYATHSPRDNCSATGSSDNYRLDLNTIYYRNGWNINGIIGLGSDGKRGMWYRFVTTTSGDYTINLEMNGDPGFELYSSCNTGITPFWTVDNSSGGSESTQLNFGSNQEIFIRFYDNDDNLDIDFAISIEH